MAAALTSTAFTRLLACLDPDRERAGEKYEDLRRTLIKFFEWRNAPFPEDHTDETFNRIAKKLGEGIDALKELIAGHRALLAGISGVGKSTIFRALGGEAIVGDVSRYGLGRQTTTAARLYRIGDGFLIDSPGVNEFGLGSLEPRELALGFREMVEPQQHCRFTDCRHLREPGCAVRTAAENGAFHARRYESYRRLGRLRAELTAARGR